MDLLLKKLSIFVIQVNSIQFKNFI